MNQAKLIANLDQLNAQGVREESNFDLVVSIDNEKMLNPSFQDRWIQLAGNAATVLFIVSPHDVKKNLIKKSFEDVNALNEIESRYQGQFYFFKR